MRAMRFALLAVVLLACGGASANENPQEKLAIMKKSEEPGKLVEEGRAFAAVGDTTRAEQYFSTAIARGADESVVVPLIIKVCVTDGRYELAIEYASRYTQKHPSDVRLRYLLGTLYAAIGDRGRARSELEYVVTAKPNDPEPHWALAKVLHDEGKDPTLADGQFREYLRLAPTGAHADEARASITTDEKASQP
jgi:tetratricopeptide (TPR) repeat protein